MFVRHRLAWFAALLALLALVPAAVSTAHEGATVPQGFSDALFVEGFAGRLTSMTFGPDGRLYVSEKQGSVRIVEAGGKLLSSPFLTIPAATDSEKGLKGIAFDPDYSATGFVYVYYTNPNDKNRVSRFTRIAGDPNHLDPASEKVLVDGINSGVYHSGGSLHFGVDK